MTENLLLVFKSFPRIFFSICLVEEGLSPYFLPTDGYAEEFFPCVIVGVLEFMCGYLKKSLSLLLVLFSVL